jgi:hypothetical protein
MDVQNEKRSMNMRCRKNKYTGLLQVLFVMLGLAWFGGCASIVGYERMYAGTPQPLSRIAILTHPNPYSQTLIIYKIDGKRAFMPGLAELTPGKHRVSAGFATTKGSALTRSEGLADIAFTAEAGHVYTIYPMIQTHKPQWQPAVWDITDELASPRHTALIEKMDAILLKNRGVTSASIATLASVPQPVELKGFGEWITTNLKPWVGRDLPISYTFNRYKPYITAKAADKAKYHLQIDQRTGRVVNVFGRTIDVGKTMDIIRAYQPQGSALAYNTVSPDDDIKENSYRIYEEQADGTFKLIMQRWWAKYEDNQYSALMPVGIIDGLPKKAIRSLVLAFNTKYSVLLANDHIQNQIQGLSKEKAVFVLESKAIMLGRAAQSRLESAFAGAGPDHQAVLQKAMAVCNRAVRSNLFGDAPPLRYDSVKVRFFPTGYAMRSQDRRDYRTAFAQKDTTFVGWELNLALPAPGKRLDYQINAHWFRPDGTLLTHQTAQAYCEATWTAPWYAKSWGNQKPGNWEPGTYRVEFFINGNKAAEENFTIQ